MGAYPTVVSREKLFDRSVWSELVFGNEVKSGRAWSMFFGRIALGFLFLWGGISKVQVTLAGGLATKGFLSGASVAGSPFAGFFNGLSGNMAVEWLVVGGELAIGISIVFGFLTRIGNVSGALMMLLFTIAMWPIADTAGANPLVDYRVLYGLMFGMFFFLRPGRFLGVDGIVSRTFGKNYPVINRVLG